MNQNSFDLKLLSYKIGDIAFVQGSSFYQECFNMWDENELDRICKNKHNPGKREFFTFFFFFFHLNIFLVCPIWLPLFSFFIEYVIASTAYIHPVYGRI
jgi:hypothetical protein